MKARISKCLKDLRRDARANVIAISAGGLFAMVGGAGVGVDTVQWYLWKRQLQQAVDSGATAGALTLAQGGSYSNSADRELDRNANEALSVSVESITNPPTTGAYTADGNAVEVIATTSRTLPFSSLFLETAPVIRSRAVATVVNGGEYCVVALADNGVGVNVAGSANVQLGCGVAADSAGQYAIDFDGGAYLDAPYLHAVGGIEASSSNIPDGTDLKPYGLPIGDPLASQNYQVPSLPSSCTANNMEVTPRQTVTLTPGRYCNGITLKGTVTMSPGVYIIDRGSFNIESQATVVGDGVTIILTGDTPSNVADIRLAGGADIDLSAPTAAENPTWKNILFFQDPMGSDTESVLAGDSYLDLEGVVYFPDGDVRFTGSSGQHSECLLLVAHRVTFTGDGSLENNCPSDFDDLDLSARFVRLVE